MKVFILVICLWATSLQAESLQDELQGFNAIADLVGLMMQFQVEYASNHYAKACQIGRKMTAIAERFGVDAKDASWRETTAKIDGVCTMAQQVAAKNFINCTKLKVVKFTCAGVSNFDNCMMIRFGDDYAEYESICL
jgi:hypothetical protein